MANPGTAHKRFGIALMVVGGVMYAMSGGSEGDNPLVFLGPVVMIAGLLLHFRGRKVAAKARSDALASPLRSSGSTVLYLRSFRSDTSTSVRVLLSGLTSDEEQLADVLHPMGEMIAIGRPGEKLPLPGATRMYASDAEWQTVVLDHMNSARLVVLRAGPGHGLFWELRESFSELTPDKFVILILNMKAKDYRAFAEEVRQNIGLELPSLAAISAWKGVLDYRQMFCVNSGFLRFGVGWTAEFLPIPFKFVRFGYNDLRGPFNEALQPVFESHGLAWRRVGHF